MNDILQFIKTITPLKVFNYLLAWLSYRLSYILKHTWQLSAPVNISVEPTSLCNLACPECPTGNGTLTRRKGDISWSLFKKVIDQSKVYLFTCTLYFQGEPLINPRIFDMINYVHSKNVYTIISTNAQFLSQKNCEKLIISGLNRLIISLDGIDQESYAKYRRGGAYQKTIDGINTFMATRKKLKKHTPVVILQFLVFSHNQHQIPQVRKLHKKLKTDKLWIKAPQISNFSKNASLLPDIPKYNRYVLHNNQYQLKGHIKNRCWRSWQNPVVTADGDLLPCCFDKNAQNTYGNITHSTMQKTWTSSRASAFKQQILKNRKAMNICRNCTEGVNYLHR